MRIARAAAAATLTILLATACADDAPETGDAGTDDATTAAETTSPAARSVSVALEPTAGSAASGTVIITEIANGVRIEAQLTGLSEGEHGFHIHETGDCSAADASSAGGHYGPQGSRHGGPEQSPPEAHIGDLGNLTADATGAAIYEGEFADMTLDGEHGVMGRAFVVHAGRDDLSTQPSGDSGDRVACGVIPAPGD